MALLHPSSSVGCALAGLALAASAVAQEPPAQPLRDAPASPPVELPQAAPLPTGDPAAAPAPGRWGGALEVGLPGGVGLALVYRPVPWARASLGAGYAVVGKVLSLGVAVTPLPWVVAPALELRGGHSFSTNAARLFGDDQGASGTTRKMLESLSYDYLSAELGADIGSRRYRFFLRAGLGTIWFRGPAATAPTMVNGQVATLSAAATRMKLTAPVARLGFLVYL